MTIPLTMIPARARPSPVSIPLELRMRLRAMMPIGSATISHRNPMPHRSPKGIPAMARASEATARPSVAGGRVQPPPYGAWP